jgi:hypothetical protein
MALAACGVALVASALLAGLFPGPFPYREWGVGCLLAAGNGAAFVAVNRLALARGGRRSISWALGGNGARAGALFMALLVVYVTDRLRFGPFFACWMAGYACFMAAEIYALYGRVYGREGRI